MLVRVSLVALVLAGCSASRPPAPRTEARAPAVVAPLTPAPSPPAELAPSREARIEMTFVGDLMFGGYFKNRYKPYRAERHDPLAAVATLLASDLAVGNLETTIARELPNRGDSHDGNGDFRFVTLPARVAVLRDRFHAVTLANNHMF